MDLEATMENFLKELASKYNLGAVYYDPFQFHRSATSLGQDGLPMVEFSQTTGNLTAMGQNIYDQVTHGNLVLYDDPILNQEARFALAKETGRGLQICKAKSSQKIDQIVALAMALHAASTAPESEQPWEFRYETEPQYRINEIGEKVSLQNLGGPGKGAFFVERKQREIWDRDW
jgi:phage terminase large subunit-like protein